MTASATASTEGDPRACDIDDAATSGGPLDDTHLRSRPQTEFGEPAPTILRAASVIDTEATRSGAVAREVTNASVSPT